MMKFGPETAALLEQAYLGRDFQARRLANMAALAPAPGARIVDLGCGAGHMTADLGRAVGPNGRVYGIDMSRDMLAGAEARCAGMANVTLSLGSAEAIPLEAGAADGLVSVQVLEYVADIDAALAECARVLRPGGRLVIGDMHFGSQVWHSADPARMERFNDHWAKHVAWTDLPAHLPPRLRAAGFDVQAVTPLTMTDTELRPDGLAQMMLILIEGFAVQNGLASAEEAADWRAEQAALAAEGRFFFALTHYVISAQRTDSGAGP